MRTIVLASEKGGSGKSTLAAHLAVCGALQDQAVAIFDCDPQGSASAWSARRGKGDVPVVSTRAAELPSLLDRAKRQQADLVLIDTQGRASIDVERAMLLADVVLVPCRPSAYDLDAGGQTARQVRAAKVSKAAFVINAAPVQGTRADEARRALEPLMMVCPVVLHQRVVFGDALSDGRSVEELDPESPASYEVRRLFRWVASM